MLLVQEMAQSDACNAHGNSHMPIRHPHSWPNTLVHVDEQRQHMHLDVALITVVLLPYISQSHMEHLGMAPLRRMA